MKSGSECWMIGTVADLESACQDEADPPASLPEGQRPQRAPVPESSVNHHHHPDIGFGFQTVNNDMLVQVLLSGKVAAI